MLPKSIEYNRIFGVVREESSWFLQSEKRKGRNDSPIFDFEKGDWCCIEKSKNNDWFILFYRKEIDEKTSFFKSFEKIEENKSTFIFKNFIEVIRDVKTGQWITKLKNNINQ
ncbi:MAG: hypothetical protein AM1032_000225 [Mycoplasmataceae bacterium]|nr:MAG: hypothetical protein AM1032_000225 [Mycoplasmataceae bacterium]